MLFRAYKYPTLTSMAIKALVLDFDFTISTDLGCSI